MICLRDSVKAGKELAGPKPATYCTGSTRKECCISGKPLVALRLIWLGLKSNSIPSVQKAMLLTTRQ